MFCPKCKTLMIPVGDELECRRPDCRMRRKIGEKDQTKVIEPRWPEREQMIIDSKVDTLPREKIECPSCGNLEAYWVIRQTRAADEPETKIYRCTKCAHTWREYG